MKGVVIAAALVAAAALAVAPPAVAQARLRVLLVVDQADDPFAERIRAELVALGLDVVSLETWRTGEAIESLDAAGRSEGASAAIRMLATRKGVEVWVANQPTGRSLLRQLIVDESPTGPNLGLVALQTAELLRTSLLSIPDPGPAKAARAQPDSAAGTTVPVVTATAKEPTKWGVLAAFGAMFSPTTGDSQMQVWLSVQRAIAGRLGIALDGSVPVASGTVTGPEGSARVSSALGGIALFMRFESSERPVYATIAVGGAIVHVSADGNATDPFVQSPTARSPARATRAPTPASRPRAGCGSGCGRWGARRRPASRSASPATTRACGGARSLPASS